MEKYYLGDRWSQELTKIYNELKEIKQLIKEELRHEEGLEKDAEDQRIDEE